MPQIKEYLQQTTAPGPMRRREATGEDFGSQIGAQEVNAGAAIQSVGDVVYKRAEQADVSDVHAKLAQAHADFTNQWEQTLRTAKPGDPNLTENFMKQYDDYMEKVQDGISTREGQNYFEKQNAQLRAHFTQSVAAGQAELAGVKAKQDYTSSLNNLSSSLINDPSSFKNVMQMHEDGLQILEAQGLPAKAVEQLRTQGTEELAKSAIRGWIKNDPQFAQKQLDGGQWDKFIDGDAKHQMFGEATQAINAQRIEAERQRQEEQRILAEQQTQTQNDFLQKMQDNKLTTKDILDSNLDPFGSGSKEQFLKLLEAGNEKAMKTDPATFRDLFSKVTLPDGDPNKIVDENQLNQYVISGKLSYEDLNHLRGEIQGGKTEQGKIEQEMKKRVFSQAEATLVKANPLMGIRDPGGEEQLLKFTKFFYDEYQAKRKAGKSSADLLSPTSPDYLGKHISDFAKTPQEIIQDQLRSAGISPSGSQPPAPIPPGPAASVAPNGQTPPAPQGINQKAPPKTVEPRKPGESAAAYLQRIGK